MNERRGDGAWLLIFLALLVGAKPTVDAATPPHHQAKRPAPLAKEATPPLVLPGSAARLAPERIYSYARLARFAPDDAVIATAVALAESAGHPRAHNRCRRMTPTA